MKKRFVLLFCISMSFVFAQNKLEKANAISEAECKSTAKFSNYQSNPHTITYDITYHKLEFTVDPAVYFISGKVTTALKALSDLTAITFDLSSQLTVSSVKTGGADLNFVQNASDELVITLPGTLMTDDSITVEISYSGVPANGGFGSFVTDTHGGVPVLWTLSEPFGARDWWPCKQDLNDKAGSIDVYITAPSQYVAVSNGVEPEAQVVNGLNKTTHFHHGYPIPAYLIAIAVTNYSVYNQTGGTAPNTYPIINYIYPENLTSVQPKLDVTPLILNLYESLFEVYPFHNEKYGHAQFGWSGGMEHTTVSFMKDFNRQLIAHEMAHQWFGDKVTCGSWNNIWLNEGFATYVATLVIENFDGLSAFVSEKEKMINNITYVPNGAVYLTDAEAADNSRIFNSRLSYNKGAMVLEMLRFKMGDAMFFQGIKNYLADAKLAYGYATTADLQSHLETVYGKSLTEFFSDWIYNQGYPTYTIAAQNWGNGQVKFIVNQTQSDPSVSYFEMPIPIRIYGANGQQADLVLNNTTNGEEFIEDVPFAVASVEFDPEKRIISKNSAVSLGNPNFDLEKEVVIYPNPSVDFLQIRIPDNLVLENVIIYNNLGQKVFENAALNIYTGNLSSGVYYIDIQTAKGTYHKKFIKK